MPSRPELGLAEPVAAVAHAPRPRRGARRRARRCRGCVRQDRPRRRAARADRGRRGLRGAPAAARRRCRRSGTRRAPTIARACARGVHAAAGVLTDGEYEHERAAGAWHAEWGALVRRARARRRRRRGDPRVPRRARGARRADAREHDPGARRGTRRVRARGEARREEAHALVGEAFAGGDPRAALAPHVDAVELDELLDPTTYLGSAEAFVDRALALYRDAHELTTVRRSARSARLRRSRDGWGAAARRALAGTARAPRRPSGHGGSPVPSAPAPSTTSRRRRRPRPGASSSAFSFCGLSLGGAVGMWLGPRTRRSASTGSCSPARRARFGTPETWTRTRRDAFASDGPRGGRRRRARALVHAGVRATSPVVVARCSSRVDPPRATRAAARRSRGWDFRDELGRGLGADARDRRRRAIPSTPPAIVERARRRHSRRAVRRCSRTRRISRTSNVAGAVHHAVLPTWRST